MTGLERGQLAVMRIQAALGSAAALAGISAGAAILGSTLDFSPWAAIAPAALLLLYPALIAPGRRFRAWGYEVGEEELRIASGVWTKVETFVPLARVQHIDLSQGPLERVFGVCRLVLHTAGTMHSRVVLPGLGKEGAEALRDGVRARIRHGEA